MTHHTVYIGLGANLGDRAAYLARALGELDAIVRVRACSAVYETEPVGYENQGWFLNMAVQAGADDGPRQLLGKLKAVEQRMGREPSVKNGPRCIDLDLLLYDDRILNEPDLVVPHPGIPDRGFVLVPLCDIAPDLMHPVLRQPVRRLLERIRGSAQVRPWPHTLPLP